MELKVDEFVGIISSESASCSQLEIVLSDYAILTKKLKDIDEQTWLFRKGIESNRKKLIRLKASFNTIKHEINKHSEKYFKNKMIDAEKTHNRIKQQPITSFLSAMLHSSVEGKLLHYKEALELKRRVGKIKAIDYYVYNTDERIKLLEY